MFARRKKRIKIIPKHGYRSPRFKDEKMLLMSAFKSHNLFSVMSHVNTI